MVFPGRFSTGCKRCRQRKVKCDETKPSCRRCYIYGKPCPGYTDQFHFRHGLAKSVADAPSETSPTSNVSSSSTTSPPPARTFRVSLARPRNPKENNNAQQQQRDAKPQDEDGTVVARRPRQARNLNIAPPLDVSYEQVSLCYFVRRFVSPNGGDSFPGHLNFLRDLYDQHSPGPLETAALSVAQMAAFNQFGATKFRVQSYQNYGNAVRTLQKAILSQEEVADDKVLATVLLLCAFKDISGEGLGDPSDHASGLYYLLERRGLEQLATQRGVELYVFALLRLQIYGFLNKDDTYNDPGGIASVVSMINPLINALSMMSRILRLRHSLSRYFSDFSGRQASTESDSPQSGRPTSPEEDPGDATIIQACFEAIEAFDEWDASAPSYWNSTFEGRTSPAMLGQVAAMGAFYDPETACVVILVRSARLILLLSMLEYQAQMQTLTGGDYGTVGGGAAWADCVDALQQDIQSTIEDMLACLPYALGDVDISGHQSKMPHDGAAALVILQSMRLVTYCSYATPDQKQRGQDVLARINATIGVRSAVSWEDAMAMASEWAINGGLFPLTSPELTAASPTPSPPSQIWTPPLTADHVWTSS